MTEDGFDGEDVPGVGHADTIGEGAEGGVSGLEGGEGAAGEAFVTGFELFEQAEFGADFGLTPGETVEFLAGALEFLLEFAEAGLAFLDGAAFGDDAGFFGFDVGLELDEALFETGAFLFELEFFGGEFFEADDVGLFLEVEGGEFVAEAAEGLSGGEGGGLGLAEGELAADEFLFDGGEGGAAFFEGGAEVGDAGLGGGEAFGDGGEFGLGGVAAILGLGDVGEGAGVLLVEFAEAFLVELDATIFAVGLGFEFGAALLGGADFVFEFGEALAQLEDFVFGAEDGGGGGFDIDADGFGGLFAFADFLAEDVELVAGELGFEVLEFGDELFVAAGFAGLALERTDLTFDLADEVGGPEEVLFRLIEFTEGFLLLAFEPGDAGGFFEDETAVFGFAAEDLGDVALGHDRVARLAHAGAGEELLDVLEAAGGFIEEVLAAAVAEDAAGDGDFVEVEVDAGGAEDFGIDIANGEGDFGHSERFPAVCTVEDDVGHLAATEGFGGLFSENPADGVGDVGFTAAVGADDAGDTPLKVQGGFIGEGFEPQHGQVLQEHGAKNEAEPRGGVKGKPAFHGVELFTAPQAIVAGRATRFGHWSFRVGCVTVGRASGEKGGAEA